MRLRAWLLAIALALGSAPALADEAPSQEQVDAGWTERLDGAEQQLAAARKRAALAEAALRNARQRRRPRGEQRGNLELELEVAQDALTDAAAALPELVEQARREGASPRVWTSYED